MKKFFSWGLASVLALSLFTSSFAASSRSSSSSSSSRSSGSSFGGSSSRSSSGSSFGSSSSSKSSGSTWGSSTKSSGSTSSGSTWGSSKSSSPQSSGSTWGSSSSTKSPSSPKMSSADSALKAKATSTGVSYKSKDEAIATFRKENAVKYNTTFVKEPSIRPTYVPRTTIIGGVNHTVIYDTRYHGYGWYVGPIWYPYSPLQDAAMMSILMANNGYHTSPNGVVYRDNTTVVYHSDGWLVFWVILSIALVGGAFAIYFYRF
jgi:hypothetical protein